MQRSTPLKQQVPGVPRSLRVTASRDVAICRVAPCRRFDFAGLLIRHGALSCVTNRLTR